MTLAGWIFMGASWTVILGLFIYSMVRILMHQKPDDSPE